MSFYGEIGSDTPDNLIAGEKVPILVGTVKLSPAKGILKRGSVIGIITVSDLGVLANKAAIDGSNAAKYILVDEVDTGSEGATEAITAKVYKSGQFNRKALIFADGNTAADHEDSLRKYGILLKDNIAY